MNVIDREIDFVNGNLCRITYGAVLDAIEATDSSPFTMDIRDPDEWSAMAEAVNVGIDSHLEAINLYNSVFDNGHCRVMPADLCILLRRLSDATDNFWEAAERLQSDILMVLGFDDCGQYVGRDAMGLE